MTRVQFTTRFKSFALRDLDIPVDVYSSDMKIVARTMTSTAITVDPDQTYYAVARLPTGRELTGYIDATGDTAWVELEPEAGDESLQESLEQTHYLTTPQEAATAIPGESALEPMGAGEPSVGTEEVTLRRITGNPFLGQWQIEQEVVVEPGAGDTVDAYPERGTVFIQLLQKNFAPITVAAPAAPGPSTTMKWVRLPAGNWSLDVHLANVVADLLVHYRAHGYVRQAAATLDSPHLDAEELLREKMADPVAAAVGGYALLRFADLPRLHNWTDNLYQWFPEFADGASIRGEHLARLGEHAAALETFLTLCDRGLPAFTDGFSYALDRIRLYLEAGTLAAPTLERAERVHELLKRLAPIVDFGSPLLTFTTDPLEHLEPSGSRPTASDEPAGAMVEMGA